MTEYVYRVVSENGSAVHMGRGSDPFTREASARSRASALTNASVRWGNGTRYTVQRSAVAWEDV